MRPVLLLVMLLLAAGVAWHFAGRGESPFVGRTQAAIRDAGDASLDQVADYWLGATGKDPAAGDAARRAAALAFAIRVGRAEAIRGGVQPVPAALKRKFRKHYDREVLDEARWTIAQPGSRLGRVLARWPAQHGAVTLGHVIVFKTRKASRSTGLFAHELAHVEQYRELGITEFARRYAADIRPLEAEATKKSRRVMRSL
ncbi:MAG TPA: DUF4157 domain-containing protein [Sphingomicrobium sp.]|nr:DUF4157 domain-containing protein [Sphingomicrobium sp.]